MNTLTPASALSDELARAFPDAIVATGGEGGASSPAWAQRAAAHLQPATTEDIAPLVQAIETAGAALIPIGGGTQLATGNAPRDDRPFVLLDTSRLNRVLDHQPDDLTVTCEPGVTLAHLQTFLAVRRQGLALDAPLPERATLGGLVATNGAGFWRSQYGTPRDLLIGVRAVMTGGLAVKGGGKVVKNVAGYDVCKLFTGAWGTLGVLTELTFRIRTLPGEQRTLAWRVPDLGTATRLGFAWHQAQLAPTFLLATNELPGAEGEAWLMMGLQGAGVRLDWQQSECNRRAREAGLADAEVLADERVQALQDRQARCDGGVWCAARVACPPAQTADFVERLRPFADVGLTVQCGPGLVSLSASNALPALLTQLPDLVPDGANLVWTRLSAAAMAAGDIAVWGRPRPEFALHRALKQSLDPLATFSPGRFLGGL